MPSVMWDMRGLVVAVAGGTRGIGLGIAEAFATAGAAVWLGGRDAATGEAAAGQLRTSGKPARFHRLDVADRASVRAFRDACLREAGRIDVWVNNAAAMARKPLLDTSEAECDRMLAVNVKGVILGCQAAGEAMIGAGGGRIINISATSSSIPARNAAIYGLTKAAVSQLTRMLALEWAPHAIRVNAIAPGPVPTNLNADILDDPKQREAILARIPLGRLGTPADVGAVALFLASPAAEYLTGQVIFVDGGRTVA